MGVSAETYYDVDAYHTYGLRKNARPVLTYPVPETYNKVKPNKLEEIAPASIQYFDADDNGHTFGYAHPGQAAYHFRDEYGNQIGSWAYLNPEGKEIRVSYIADSQGFRVVSNELPVAPTSVTDTPEVAAARAEHIAAHKAIKSRWNTLLFDDENLTQPSVLQGWY